MLIMRTLEPHVHNEYIVIYVHTTLSPENEPSFGWLRKVYSLFDRRLKENLYLMVAQDDDERPARRRTRSSRASACAGSR